MIEIQFDNQQVLSALQQLEKSAANMEPALLSIGDELAESTKQRFSSSSGPDGQAWPANKSTTLARKGNSNPLIAEGTLMENINFQLADHNTVEIGSPMEYAAMQQFGGTKAEFPHLWGDIPARPFLGVSDEDEKEILEIVQEHLQLT